MKEITLNNLNYLLVEVPDDAFDFSTNYEDKYTSLYSKLLSNPDSNAYNNIDEPSYEDKHSLGCILETSRSKGIPELKIIGKISDIIKDEDVCKGLIEDNREFLYKNYISDNDKAEIGRASCRERV